METFRAEHYKELKLQLDGYLKPGQGLYRNVLFDQLYASQPKEPQARVQIYNAEIAPGGYTNWHCHNGATFFVALQGCSRQSSRKESSSRRKPATSTPSRLRRSTGGTIRTTSSRTCVSASRSQPPTASR